MSQEPALDSESAAPALLPVHDSSGDLLADRRFEWARGHMDRGELAAAADLVMQSLEIAPDYGSAWFALGEIRARLGDRPAAELAFRKSIALDPADRRGARLQLMRLGAEPAGDMPPAYVRALFDNYAPAFDRRLRDRLDYRGPELLLGAVASSGRTMQFSRALDLGCGTGLAAAVFRPHCAMLTGVDLSPGMIARARAKGLYDRLLESDAVAFLRRESAAGAKYDLVLAADVFVYLNDLAPVIAAAAAVMAGDGLLVFSVETHDGDGVLLRETLRYAHGRSHVLAALGATGLVPLGIEAAATRNEKGIAVSGLIVVAQRKQP